MASLKNREVSLVEGFVASFEKLDEMTAWDHDLVACELATGDPDEFGRRRWQPRKIDSQPELLEPIYSRIPARFPPIFERLVLSYRWAEIDLQSYRLLANPPGDDLSGLFEQMSKDPFLWGHLVRAGYIRFGMGADIDYDPVCFDLSSRKKNRDCRIVKINHEQILCNNRVKVVAEIAPSFESLVLRTIEQANQKP